MRKTTKSPSHLLAFALIVAAGVLGFGGSVRAADLLECNWDTGTGTSATAVRGGTFNNGYEHPDMWEVHADDGSSPGGRNYLTVSMPPTSSSWIYGHTSFSNPATVYIRYYIRMKTGGPVGVHTLHFGKINDVEQADRDLFSFIFRIPMKQANLLWDVWIIG